MIKIAAMVGTPDLQQETLAVYTCPIATAGHLAAGAGHSDLEAAFRKLAALGYDGVEFMIRDPAQLDGARIRRWLDENRLELVGLCTGHVYGEDGLGLVGPDPDKGRRAMARLKYLVDFAADYCGSETRFSRRAAERNRVSKPLVNIGRSRGPGYPNDTPRTLDHMAEAFQELADYALPRGVRLVLEPVNCHQAQVIHTTQDGLDMVRRVNRPNFGLMLDVYHMNIEDVDIYDSFREAGELCWFVHLADNNRKWPGSAHLDFERIVAVLNEIGYAGFVSLEILPWPDPDTAARSSIESLRRFIGSKT
jgi:sugar phosphate isomerase/epimerase